MKMKIGGKKVKICCMNLAIAVRVIGCLGFFASLILVLQLSTELWEHDGKSRIAALLEIQDIVVDETATLQHSYRNVCVLVGLMAFSCCYLVSSALLIYASIVKKWAFTVPWLVCEIFGFATQVGGLVSYSERHGAAPDAWPYMVTIFSLVLTLYFFVTVVCSLFEWRAQTSGQLVLSPRSPGRFQVGFDNHAFANSVQISKLPV